MKSFHFTEITSTNDFAKELLNTLDSVIVTADYQTKGRGRNNKSWEGDFGKNVYFSLGINHKEEFPFEKIMLYQALGAIAVKNALNVITPKETYTLKYPNDVLAKAENIFKKISGVITEHSFIGQFCSQSVLGIGINISQTNFSEELKDKATSLSLLGYNIETKEVIEILTEEILKLLKYDYSDIMNLWKKTLNIENKIITLVENNERYFVERINSNGTLLTKNVETETEKIIDNGDSIRYEYE